MTIETSLSKGWVIRTMIWIIVAFGLAIWAFIDAEIVYPKKGERYASFVEMFWLQSLEGRLRQAPQIVADPNESYTTLMGKVEAKTNLSQSEQDQLAWLKALRVIGKLDEAPERVADPAQRRDELNARFQGKGMPKKVNPWDIPTQWFILAVGGLIGIWSSYGLFSASRHKFIYNEDDASLTIDGTNVAAADMEGLDKSRWQKKSIAYLITKDGERHKLDAWIYAKLEDIVDTLDEKLEGGKDSPAAEQAEVDQPAADNADDETPSDEED